MMSILTLTYQSWHQCTSRDKCHVLYDKEYAKNNSMIQDVIWFKNPNVKGSEIEEKKLHGSTQRFIILESLYHLRYFNEFNAFWSEPQQLVKRVFTTAFRPHIYLTHLFLHLWVYRMVYHKTWVEFEDFVKYSLIKSQDVSTNLPQGGKTTIKIPVISGIRGLKEIVPHVWSFNAAIHGQELNDATTFSRTVNPWG